MSIAQKNMSCWSAIKSSPLISWRRRCGKTSVVIQTILALKNKVRIGVIEGDIASSIDAET